MTFLIQMVDIAFRLYTYIIIARVLLSWVRHDPYHPVFRFIYEITEPVLGFFRRIIPPIGVIDISPIVALFVVSLVRVLVLNILARLAF
ncbi:MAG: YggT family protein [Bacillota bacterium]